MKLILTYKQSSTSWPSHIGRKGCQAAAVARVILQKLHDNHILTPLTLCSWAKKSFKSIHLKYIRCSESVYSNNIPIVCFIRHNTQRFVHINCVQQVY
jgi:hypothetical protein